MVKINKQGWAERKGGLMTYTVKHMDKKTLGSVGIGNIYFPKEYIGKRIMIKIEVVEDIC